MVNLLVDSINHLGVGCGGRAVDKGGKSDMGSEYAPGACCRDDEVAGQF